MEDPEDSFSSARHLLLEVVAEQEGCSLFEAVRTVQASHRHYGNEHDCRGLVRDSLTIRALLSWVQGAAFH